MEQSTEAGPASASGASDGQEGWRLRRATLEDVDGLQTLASEPLVYRYLFGPEEAGGAAHLLSRSPSGMVVGNRQSAKARPRHVTNSNMRYSRITIIKGGACGF